MPEAAYQSPAAGAAQTEAGRCPRPRPTGLFGLVLAGGLLVALFRWVDLGELWSAVVRIGALPTALALVLLWLTLPLRAVQWAVLLNEHTMLQVRRLFHANSLGYLGNAILPARGGEWIRLAAAVRATRFPPERIFLSIVLARIHDLPPLLVLTLATLAIVSNSSLAGTIAGAIPALIGLLLVISLGCLTLYFLLRISISWLASHKDAYRRRSTVPSWVQGRLMSLRFALHASGSTRNVVVAQLLAFGCWGFYAAGPSPFLYQCGLRGLDLLATSLVLTTVTTLANALPITPAGWGTSHAAGFAALAAFAPQLPAPDALALVVLLHLVGALGPAAPAVLLVWPAAGLFPVGSSSANCPRDAAASRSAR